MNPTIEGTVTKNASIVESSAGLERNRAISTSESVSIGTLSEFCREEKTTSFRRIHSWSLGIFRVMLILSAIVVFQNFETTSIDVLLWRVVSIPKLGLIASSMAVGALPWEFRRIIRAHSIANRS